MIIRCPWLVVLSGYSGFLHQLNWSPWYSWNIVESGIKTKNQIKSNRDHKVVVFTTFFLYPSIFFTQIRSSVQKNSFSRCFTINQTSSLCLSPVGPTRKKNSLWWPCLLMDRDEISNLYKGPSIGVSYQVSVHLAKWFHSRRLKCEKLTDGRRTLSDGKSSQNVIGFLPPWCGFYH